MTTAEVVTWCKSVWDVWELRIELSVDRFRWHEKPAPPLSVCAMLYNTKDGGPLSACDSVAGYGKTIEEALENLVEVGRATFANRCDKAIEQAQKAGCWGGLTYEKWVVDHD